MSIYDAIVRTSLKVESEIIIKGAIVIAVIRRPFGTTGWSLPEKTHEHGSGRVSVVISGVELETAPEGQIRALITASGREPLRMHIAGDSVLVIEGEENDISEAVSGLQDSAAREFPASLNAAMINAITGGVKSIRCDKMTLDFSEPRIMGVLNVTPDSFSDGGMYCDKQSAVDRALQMIEDGAYIVDVGGESTRPGSSPVSSEEELRRILPVIREIRSRTAVPISVDTYHPDVAKEALRAGADIVNDVTGLRTGEMRNVIRDADCPFVTMHMLGMPASMQKSPQYEDVVYEVMRFLAESLRISEEDGIDVTKGIVDPGIGFGKSFQHNITLLNRLDELLTLGHPVLLGASRKSFIGGITGGGKQNRLEGSLAAAVLAYAKGVKLLRVHDVLETRRALSVARCIVTGKMTEDRQQTDERP